MIDTSELSNVLEVDTKRKTALVEPNVSMDALVQSTLTYGLLPRVVMEFPKITVGGGFSGTSGESSSFRHGLFESTISRVEIVLGNGEVAFASADENPDLFYGAASSFGTLGVVTLLEVRLMDAMSFVELTYHPVTSTAHALAKLQEATKDSTIDYLDAIIYDQQRGVVCLGRLTDSANPVSPITRFARARDEWFYIHAERLLRTHNGPVTETVPLVDYLFRYDRGGFWVGSFAFKYFHTPFNYFMRWFLDDFLHTDFMYRALHLGGLSDRYIIQDVGVPMHKAEEFLTYLDGHLKCYPLWLCPLRQGSSQLQSTFSSFTSKQSVDGPEMMLNIGVWGIGPTVPQELLDINRTFEKMVYAMDGKKWLYGHTYYTEEEFWNIYDRERYEALRVKYYASYLPNVFDKVRSRTPSDKASVKMTDRVYNWIWNIWPLRGLYGLFQAAIGAEYLVSKTWSLIRLGTWIRFWK